MQHLLEQHDAVLVFENGVTHLGANLNEFLLQEFPELREYFVGCSDLESELQLGQMWLVPTQRPKPRWLLLCPIDNSWTREVPMFTLFEQLAQVKTALTELRPRSLGIFAVTAFESAVLREMRRYFEDDLEMPVSIFHGIPGC